MITPYFHISKHFHIKYYTTQFKQPCFILFSLYFHRICRFQSYLSLVNNASYGADHAGCTGAKHLFDPLLLQSRAQLAHGQVALRYLKLTLHGHRRQRKRPEEMWWLIWNIYPCTLTLVVSSDSPISRWVPGCSGGLHLGVWCRPEVELQVPPLERNKQNKTKKSLRKLKVMMSGEAIVL